MAEHIPDVGKLSTFSKSAEAHLEMLNKIGRDEN